MASNRHLGRIIVLQSLYEYEFRERAGDANVDLDLIVAKNIEPYSKALGDTEFVYALARAVNKKSPVKAFETAKKTPNLKVKTCKKACCAKTCKKSDKE